MMDYVLNCYWNKNWLPKISSRIDDIKYPLEYFPTVESGVPTDVDGLYVPSGTPPSAAQPVLWPGVWPANPGAPGFQQGDTIQFSFQVAGGNTSPPEMLTECFVTFMREESLTTTKTNPIGITQSPDQEVIVTLGGKTYNQYTWECADLQSQGSGPTFAQLFQAEVGSQLETTFTFSGGNRNWVLGVEAVYLSGPTEMRFRFDPEWMVGNG